MADEVTWRAAYECQFVDEAHALLPYDLLLARVDQTLSYHLNMNSLSDNGSFFAGYDVGRKRDLSALVLLERKKRQLYWRGAVELRTAPFDEQHQLLVNAGLAARRRTQHLRRRSIVTRTRQTRGVKFSVLQRAVSSP